MYTGKMGAYKATVKTGSAISYSATDGSEYVITRQSNGKVKVTRIPQWCEPVTAEYTSMRKALLAIFSNPLHLSDCAVWHPTIV